MAKSQSLSALIFCHGIDGLSAHPPHPLLLNVYGSDAHSLTDIVCSFIIPYRCREVLSTLCFGGIVHEIAIFQQETAGR